VRDACSFFIILKNLRVDVYRFLNPVMSFRIIKNDS
jgi:hypothetical protein